MAGANSPYNKKQLRDSEGTFRLTPARLGGISLPRSEGKGYDLVEKKGSGALTVHPALLSNPRMALSAFGYTPLPNRLRATLKYVSNCALASGVTPGVHVFSANGLYDPDITGTGHQPRGFDQLIALYDHYVVTASKCRVEFPGATGTTVAGVELQSSSSTQSDYIDYAEQARCVFNIAPYCITTGGFPEPLKHTLHFDAAQFMGIPDPVTSSKLQGAVNANPTDQAYYHVFSQHIDGSTSTSQSALVYIEYEVVFIEPVPVASS